MISSRENSTNMGIKVLVLSSIFFHLVYGDVYLQNPSGSNGRLRGEGRDRNGQEVTRLFDSQNNNRGGYNVGRSMEYYVNSILRIEWTNQHSCGGINNNCELIVQYMCDDRLRDGSNNRQIPDVQSNCENNNCNQDYEFGMHEDFEHYETCRYTEANNGLFAGDQNPGPTARRTRQDDKGTRHGYECPEERDYYPYWRPSPWKDIVIMTNDVSRCDYYKAESENVKPRYYCKPPPHYLQELRDVGDNRRDIKYIPITKEACEKLTNDVGESGEWLESPAHNIDPPECIPSPKTRDNHNGNTVGGKTPFYNWEIPNEPSRHCAIRMRYNISTNDIDSWNSDSMDSNTNAPIYKIVGLDSAAADEIGYVLKADPIISPITGYRKNGQDASNFQLQLNVDTSQYGRTFEDRSHSFVIKERPSTVPADDTIQNVNVRGKRGNIVQTYPATEYDFVPNSLTVTCDQTWIHFQWTGANTNPGNNAGQGRRQTDRSNICQLDKNNYPKNGDSAVENKHGHLGSSYPSDMRKGTNFLGLSDEQERMLCTSGMVNGANSELNDAGVYFNMNEYFPKDGGLVKCRCEEKTQVDQGGNEIKVKVRGVWYYLCTRNNNFTNRSQKATIICE